MSNKNNKEIINRLKWEYGTLTNYARRSGLSYNSLKAYLYKKNYVKKVYKQLKQDGFCVEGTK